MMQSLRSFGLALAVVFWSGADSSPTVRGNDRPDQAGSAEFAIPPGDPHQDSPQQRGRRANSQSGLVLKMRLDPHWFDGNDRFWYRNELKDGAKEFILVDAAAGTRAPAFDHARLAAALSRSTGKSHAGDRLPFDEIQLVDGGKSIRFRVAGEAWVCDRNSYECVKAKEGDAGNAASPRDGKRGGPDANAGRQRRPPETSDSPGVLEGLRSPDGKWSAYVKDHNIVVFSFDKKQNLVLSHDGKAGLGYGRLSWSPDSKTLVAFRIEPGDRKEVHLVQSSPPGGGRARLRSRPYPLPGDKFTSYELHLFDVAAGKAIRPGVDPVNFGRPELRWQNDGRHFTYEKVDRGHQRYRLIRVDSRTGETQDIIDEKMPRSSGRHTRRRPGYR